MTKTLEIYIHEKAPAAIAALVAAGTRPGTATLVVESFLEGDENAPTAAQAAIIRPLLVRMETAEEAAERDAASAAHDASRAAVRAQDEAVRVAEEATRAAAAAVDDARGGAGNVADIFRRAPHLCNVSFSSASHPGDDQTDSEGNQVWADATPYTGPADDTYAREVWARVARGGRILDVLAEMGPDPAREAIRLERAAENAAALRIDGVESRISALANPRLVPSEASAVELDAYAADSSLPHWVSSRAQERAADVRKNVAYRAAHAAEVARMEAVSAARREAKASRRGGHATPSAVIPPPPVNLNDPWAALGNIALE